MFRPHQVVMSRFASYTSASHRVIELITASVVPSARCMLVVIAGCSQTEPIVTYTVPTEVPAELVQTEVPADGLARIACWRRCCPKTTRFGFTK